MSAIISLTRIKSIFRSLRWQFVVAYLLIIIIAFTIVTASVIQLVGEYLFNQRVREEERVAAETAQEFAPMFLARDAAGMYHRATEISQQYDSQIIVLDEYGIVQVDSQSRLNGHRLAIEQVANVLGGSESDYGYYQAPAADAIFLTHSEDAGVMTGVYSHAIHDKTSISGVLLYISKAQDIYIGLSSVTRQISMILLAVFAVIGLFSIIIVNLFTRPVKDLSDGIQQISKGDFTARVRVRGKNEFSELARAFNSMSSRMEVLDRSRNQFVSNASHELKTPLSTMKILLQTILYQEVYDPEISKEFLTDIDKEIDRLSYVISDLLTLVSIDSGELRLKTAPLSLRDLIRDNVKRLLPLARERGIELEFTCRENVETMGDMMKLNQVFYNLIDNAIKYTPRGGSVRVDLVRQGKMAVGRVTDTGIGIPAEDQIHIFDRFYRVDKARSRETGGTGLGLSIVKQIVLLHSGNIFVTSEENVGSTFTVELPILMKSSGGKSA